MQQIELIVICLIIGVLLRWSGKLPDATPKALGGWVIYVSLPATAIHSVHNLSFNDQWLLAAATPWIGVALAIAVLWPVSRAFGWSRQRTGALLLSAGWGNTSFVGLPMIAAFAGAQWVGLGVVIDLFGSYLALSIVGITIATICNGEDFDWKLIVFRILTFPPFIAILVALATNHYERPEWIDDAVKTLASTLTPLALAAVGYALRLDAIAGRWGPLGLGLSFRLLMAPLAILLMYLALGALGEPVTKVAILEMAMPPMLGASIIALDHDLEPDLVALMIGIGVPLSILTAWGWWSMLNAI
jgi:malate permease and related proteins